MRSMDFESKIQRRTSQTLQVNQAVLNLKLITAQKFACLEADHIFSSSRHISLDSRYCSPRDHFQRFCQIG